jgi:NADPH-dependent ferric siderophore reductase
LPQSLPVRFIEVTSVRRITPRMARITFGGPELADFSCEEPDQQVKLYFPKPGQSRPRMPEPGGDFGSWYEAFNAIPETERPWMRSFTLRRHDSARATIDIDFVLHGDAGPASRWASRAEPGEVLAMFGPSDTFARPVPIATSMAAADWILLAGDETTVPAISTLLESLPQDAKAIAYLEVQDSFEEQEIDGDAHWLHRGDVPAGKSDVLVKAVREAEFPPGPVFAWLGGESSAVRELRRHLVSERGIPKRAIEFAGYWRARLTQDDAPTEDDLADAQEILARTQELARGS